MTDNARANETRTTNVKPYFTRQTEDFPTMATEKETTATFMNLDFELGPNVLVPRKETELLGTVCIDRLSQGTVAPVVVDMCCGCGNLGIVIATKIDDAQVWSCDLTPETVDVAWRNVIRFGLQDRMSVVQGDMFENIRSIGLEGHVDLVVCNPPYISSSRLEADRAHLLESEPREAFDGGPYGISIQQRLIRDAVEFLKPGGWLAFEFGEGQERQAAALLARTRAYVPVQFILDPSGIPRVALAMKLSGGQ
ncbi:peptide chain release factor N(5)-glutamine methyltransferase [Rhizobium sp. ICMP 5592]|nr:peptide chain release factor N(5)-glutamine methyltransferase [Rhizobium sp. ICMP 5592]